MPHLKDNNGVSQRCRAYDLLRQALMLRQIAAGQRLRETEWAERLSVNRTAIREACGRLCVEGFVVEGPRRGYFAARPDADEVQDVLEIRIMLEAGAIERICRLGLNKPKGVRPLVDACDELEWLLRKNYRAQLGESDRRFHEALISMAGNKRLMFMYRCVPPMDHEPEVCDGPAWDASGRTMLVEHRDILAAIQKGRVADAQKLLRVHLTEKPRASIGDGVVVA
jgi:DNA-binding GntR family transcriptional regulator